MQEDSVSLSSIWLGGSFWGGGRRRDVKSSNQTPALSVVQSKLTDRSYNCRKVLSNEYWSGWRPTVRRRVTHPNVLVCALGIRLDPLQSFSAFRWRTPGVADSPGFERGVLRVHVSPLESADVGSMKMGRWNYFIWTVFASMSEISLCLGWTH